MKNSSVQISALAQQAVEHFAAGRDDLTLADLNRAIDVQGDWSALYFTRGLVYDKIDQPFEAVEDLTRAIELSPNDPDLYYFRGAVGQRVDARTALADYGQAIALDPAHGAAYLGRALLYEAEGNFPSALTDCACSLQIAPNDRTAQMLFDRLHERLFQSYSEQIRRQPQAAGGYVERGLFLHTAGKSLEALTDLTNAIELDPRDSFNRSLRGFAHITVGKFAAAVADFTEALNIDPETADYYAGRATAFLELDQSAEAFTDIQAALEQQPENPQYRLLRAKILISAGRYADGVAELDTLAPEYANHPDFFEFYSAAILQNANS